jgi:hypothetical protein
MLQQSRSLPSLWFKGCAQDWSTGLGRWINQSRIPEVLVEIQADKSEPNLKKDCRNRKFILLLTIAAGEFVSGFSI